MVRITEEMVRKRSEHNELVISTLEEISLHQQDIERIEHLDKWCRDLKILYLQSNLIPKIENVSRMKKLEYLNLALNNIEKIENLEGCESLTKLDLTVNFVGDLLGLESLKGLRHFNELFLTGNPCTEFDGYREFVIATLPQLKRLDGTEVEKSERILAVQALPEIRQKIVRQVESHHRKREKEKEEIRLAEERKKRKKERKPGFDGRWYTDMNKQSTPKIVEIEDCDEDEEGNANQTTEKTEEEQEEEDDKEFWDEKVAFTPESRIQVHEHMKEKRERDENKGKKPEKKRERKLQTEDGRILNVNEPKLDFTLTDSEDAQQLLLDIPVYKYLDTSAMDVDVQPTYVKVVVKGKVLQLVLPEEVKPDSSTAQRSQITGHLLLTMPKENPPEKVFKREKVKEKDADKENAAPDCQQDKTEKLEVDPSLQSSVDIQGIVKDPDDVTPPLGSTQYRGRKHVEERENSADFVDDPDVPPLM